MDISPLFSGRDVDRQRPFYWENQFGRHLGIAMREGDWKLKAPLDLSTFELYNLHEDIGETTNLAGPCPERLSAMATKMKRIHEEINAEAPKWKE